MYYKIQYATVYQFLQGEATGQLAMMLMLFEGVYLTHCTVMACIATFNNQMQGRRVQLHADIGSSSNMIRYGF